MQRGFVEWRLLPQTSVMMYLLKWLSRWPFILFFLCVIYVDPLPKSCLCADRSSASSPKLPTYGVLIDLLDRNDEAHLYSEFKSMYPLIPVGRPKRFYETVQRIAAPTRPSLISGPKLHGSPLRSYRRRLWEPRIRNSCTTSVSG